MRGGGSGNRHACVSSTLRTGVERFGQAASRKDAEAQNEALRFAVALVAKCETDGGLLERTTDFPVMSEGIDDAA